MLKSIQQRIHVYIDKIRRKYLAEKLANNGLEGISEVPGKEGVYEGVDGRVAVP